MHSGRLNLANAIRAHVSKRKKKKRTKGGAGTPWAHP